ncbi:MAG TPA: hypothetical protein V6C78_25455 [Crinalium sp.]|jgi:hypothetical protein
MKTALIAALGTLFLIGSATISWADEPPSTDASPSGNASQLAIPDSPAQAAPRDNTEQMNTLANQINRQVSDRDEPDSNADIIPLKLPEGIVIRGTSTGGFTLGTEL